MRSAKSIGSLTNQQQPQQQQQQRNQPESSASTTTTANNGNNNNNGNTGPTSPTSPICRCRVTYLGSSVPHITKDGLQGIQEPLRELYPDKAALGSGNVGIDSWLSVWSNGILIENVDETGREVKRFFKIEALHYCAAVKFVPMPLNQQQLINPYTTLPNGKLSAIPKFLPLDSPHARQTNNNNPPIFASIIRRTTGIKVLECHAFICKREAAANALVRCCFHAYADTMYAKQVGADVVNGNDINNNNQLINEPNSKQQQQQFNHHHQANSIISRRSKSIAALNDATVDHSIVSSSSRNDSSLWRSSNGSNYQNGMAVNGNSGCDNQHDSYQQQQDGSSMIRRKSMNEHCVLNCDIATEQQASAQNLKRQQKLSKSMHHLNHQPNNDGHGMTAYNNDYDQISQNNQAWPQVPPNQPFYNPYTSRVPSYPPQNMIDATSTGGTLRSIKSMAANSIASTLLRSKKHAKAMSVAHMNQQQQQLQDKITSFHQNTNLNSNTLAGPLMMPSIPTMFLPNMPPHAAMMNGSQTMKVPNSRQMMVGPPHMNYEAITPKEMKKLLKKSIKYGKEQQSKFGGENGLPPPLLPPAMHHQGPMQMPMSMSMPLPLTPQLSIPPQACHMLQPSKSGTMISQTKSMYSDVYGNDMPDLASIHAGGLPPAPMPRGTVGCPPPMMDPQFLEPQMKLVKPNPEFLKSKAGKKWLKQQKEFKKLLPPHLTGLPIIYGPPPIEALEPAGSVTNKNGPAPAFISSPHHHHQLPPPPLPPHSGGQGGIPIMDSSGFYNPNLPFYGQANGRASAASTLLRYSPHSQMMHDNSNGGGDYMQQRNNNHIIYGNSMLSPNAAGAHSMIQQQRLHGEYSGDETSMIFGSGNNDCGIDDPQHQATNHRAYAEHVSNNRHQKRNHMVEQRVISLGDEIDFDDEEEEGGNVDEDSGGGGDSGEQQQNDYYSANNNNNHESEQHTGQRRTVARTSQSGSNSRDHNHDNEFADDQSSYSSGIYRRGHINERAFSYSIRQEHKSNSDVEQECHMNHHDNQQQQQQHSGNMYQQVKHDRNEDYQLYHDNNNGSQSIPVNELTARLENQLNMKSFSNSRIKSHM